MPWTVNCTPWARAIRARPCRCRPTAVCSATALRSRQASRCSRGRHLKICPLAHEWLSLPQVGSTHGPPTIWCSSRHVSRRCTPTESLYVTVCHSGPASLPLVQVDEPDEGIIQCIGANQHDGRNTHASRSHGTTDVRALSGLFLPSKIGTVQHPWLHPGTTYAMWYSEKTRETRHRTLTTVHVVSPYPARTLYPIVSRRRISDGADGDRTMLRDRSPQHVSVQNSQSMSYPGKPIIRPTSALKCSTSFPHPARVS